MPLIVEDGTLPTPGTAASPALPMPTPTMPPG